uniref:K Homology domain-containing protein n=1 Tax=Kryptolebias marmoratus TaxID=37003 RepID=A0A3Q3AUM2_KRYMA
MLLFRTSAEGGTNLLAKLIVPNSTAGLIIGKGGATVKAVMEQSGAWVQLSQKPEGINLQERVVTISGEPEQNRKAVEIIVQKIQEDPQSSSSTGTTPTLWAWAILGKGGKTLVEYQELTGARIQISKKGEFIPGTRNRKVTITGSQAATQAAQYLISQRITYDRAFVFALDSPRLPQIPSPSLFCPAPFNKNFVMSMTANEVCGKRNILDSAPPFPCSPSPPATGPGGEVKLRAGVAWGGVGVSSFAHTHTHTHTRVRAHTPVQPVMPSRGVTAHLPPPVAPGF